MEGRNKKTIKDLPKVERPKEKLIKYGPEKLSNFELFINSHLKLTPFSHLKLTPLQEKI